MTALLIQFGWLVVRITVLAVMAVVLARWTARCGARSTVVVLTGAMMVLLVVTVAACRPLPDSCRWSPPLFEFAGVADRPTADGAGAGRVSGSAAVSASDSPVAPDAAEPEADGLTLVRTLNMLRRWHAETPRSDDWQRCAMIVLGIYSLGVCIAGGRLLAGGLAVMALRRRSRPVTDTALLELADSLRIALGHSGPCQLSECDEPGLAATVGWWRPVVFLPPEWRSWSELERRAVLAHELAHAHHRDYLSALLAGCCRALHFYHPLVRWLTSQLRWQQEVAADALAATAVGDRTQYLKALASLALRLPARKSAGAMAWSAMNGGTLLRRICMLRGTEKSRPMGWTMRGLLVSLLAVTGLVLATLGSSAKPPEPSSASRTEPFELGYIPADTTTFLAIRPSYLMTQPDMDRVKKAATFVFKDFEKAGLIWPEALKPENIDEVVLSINFGQGIDKLKQPTTAMMFTSLFMRLHSEFDWPGFFKTLNKFGVTDSVEIGKDGMAIYSLHIPALAHQTTFHFYMPDRRTVVFFDPNQSGKAPQSAEAFRQLIRNVDVARQRSWGSGYSKLSGAAIVSVLDNRNQQRTEAFAREFDAAQWANFQNVEFGALCFDVGEGPNMRLVLDTKSAETALEVEKCLESGMQVLLENLKQGLMDKNAEKFLHENWQSHKMSRDGARVEWLSHSSVGLQHIMIADDDTSKEPAKGKSD